jgi:MOSC domain-containing protein YiiM
MREVPALEQELSPGVASFRACLATILELSPEELPTADEEPDPATGWALARWLGGLGLGLTPIADPAAFSWAGPWLARVDPADGGDRRTVVMYGVPSGVAWDPTAVTAAPGWTIAEGFVVAALDVALARPPLPDAPTTPGRLESILIASTAGAAMVALESVRALPGLGLEGDRHVAGTGTFPSGKPGSALTLIEAEVCESFSPPLASNEHRRNLITRGIDLNQLVGREFAVGEVRCRGMRLCEPCAVVERYAQRPVLRALVHRGGLRADILDEGSLAIGDSVVALAG